MQERCRQYAPAHGLDNKYALESLGARRFGQDSLSLPNESKVPAQDEDGCA
jgi:hypothetical protein